MKNTLMWMAIVVGIMTLGGNARADETQGAGALKDAQGKISNTLEKIVPGSTVELDRNTYARLAEEQLNQVKKRSEDLRGKAQKTEESKQKWSQASPDLDKKQTEAEVNLSRAKAATEDNLKESKRNLDGALKDYIRAVDKAAAETLPAREAYEWKAQTKLDAMDQKIKMLKSKEDSVQGEVKATIQTEVDKLIQKKDQAQTKFGELQKATDYDWDARKAELEKIF